jgi:cytochrome c oxidase cbb3-type subunit 3
LLPSFVRSSRVRRAALALGLWLAVGGCASEASSQRSGRVAAPPRTLRVSSGSAGGAQDTPPSLAASAEPDPYAERAQQEFVRLCAACHGSRGEGQIGPNLTDGLSIHRAASAEDYRVIIAEGVPTRGMPLWGQVIQDPALVSALARYVWSLRNTHAEGGRAPQGDFTLP